MRRHLLAAALLAAMPGAAAAQTTDQMLDTIQHAAFDYFWNEVNLANGLIRDRSTSGSPCSIASQGFGLSAICIGVERGWITRAQGRTRVLQALNTYWSQPQGPANSGTIGFRGLFYHFLDMTSATRTWDSELSTIDTALLLAGVLHAMEFFDGSDPDEVQIRALADQLYRRADWEFMRNFAAGIHMGWKPATGFGGFGLWVGYNEAMILYILALGSPTHPVPASTWTYWTSNYSWQTHYGQSYVNFPPLFGHQYSHCWIDFRLVNDAYMENRGITYFENSRRATLAQQAYCIDNPFDHAGYSDSLWGITASDFPGGYMARGAPPAQNDEGTITPTAPAASLPFAPEIVIPTLRNMHQNYPLLWGPYGFRDAFNLNPPVWYDPEYVGIDQGPIVIMIENYRSSSVWLRMMSNPYIQTGLQRAGFIQLADVEPGGAASDLDFAPARPNPFTRRTTLRFTLPEAAHARLDVFDVSGRRVATLVDERLPAGAHVATLDGRGLTSGVYLCVLEAGGKAALQRCVRLE
jgi:hypothetical protein